MSANWFRKAILYARNAQLALNVLNTAAETRITDNEYQALVTAFGVRWVLNARHK